MKKVTFIGGGSSKFVSGFVVDLLNCPDLVDSHVFLMDIDKARVERTEGLVKKIIETQKIPMTVESTTDQRRALDGADFVINTIMVGGMKHYESDTFIPARHGVSVAVGDTIGPGAVFRSIRTFPVLKQMVDNLREVSPNAWVLNYTNPMTLVTAGLIAYGHKNVAGFCHSVQGMPEHIHKWLGIPVEEVDYLCAGCNHIAFFLKLEHKGRDLYPDLLANADQIIKKSEMFDAVTNKWKSNANYERIRLELIKYLGYIPAEGPFHQSEYYPWFRKNQTQVDEYGAKTGWGCEFDRLVNAELDNIVDKKIKGEMPLDFNVSHEYGIPTMQAISTGKIYKCNVSVLNQGSITNLPNDAVVEVPCLVDEYGIHPTAVGALPTQLVGVIHPHIVLHKLTIEGILAKNKTLIRQAIQADPLTSACLTLPQIQAMTDDLIEENKEYMKDW